MDIIIGKPSDRDLSNFDFTDSSAIDDDDISDLFNQMTEGTGTGVQITPKKENEEENTDVVDNIFDDDDDDLSIPGLDLLGEDSQALDSLKDLFKGDFGDDKE